MRKKRLIVTVLLLAVGLPILGVVGYRIWRGPVANTDNPRPDAGEAPVFNPSKPGESSAPTENPSGGENGTTGEGNPGSEPPPARGDGEQTAEEPIDDWQRYGWPDDFKLPLEFTFDDLPEVPEAISSPLPPAEKEE